MAHKEIEQLKQAIADAKPDNDAVDYLARHMKKKLSKKRQQGYSGWQVCTPSHLSKLLIEHVAKGDPVDVANFCAFLFARNEPIFDGTVKDLRDWLIIQYPLTKQELVDLMGATVRDGQQEKADD